MKRNFLFLILLTLLSVFHVVNIEAADSMHSYFPRIVKISSDSELDSLVNQNVEILRRRGDILLCLFPDTPTRSGVNDPRVRFITPALDIAKGYFDAVSIQNGNAFETPFSGNGVVVGICDVGIDPLHPTFLDADGHSRIKRVVQYIESDGIRLQLEGDEDYRKWGTDNPEQFHATHVCGILAGSGAGSPFSGIATDADIVVTVSTLTDVGLLAGVEDIIDYAREVGKPAVINISVGSYTGPHDGSSLFSQYLDMCADDAIIVLSAGNEGEQKNSLIADFGPDCSTVSFRLGNRAWDQYKMYGATEIWSGSAEPLSVALGIYDTNQKSIIRWFDDFTVTEDTPCSYVWEGTDMPEEGFPFVGELMVEGEVNPENGRHSTIFSYDFTSDHQSSEGGWARYELAVKVTGHPGDDVEVYADGVYTRLVGLSGSPRPSTDRSVSDLACGFKVISVGMYGNRDSVILSPPVGFPDDDTYSQSTGYDRGLTVSHSSYGTLRDGRVLPLTTAPGAPLMSAGSRPFFELFPYHPHLRLGDAVWVDEGGTSMSSPYVAGYIATWLEAVPTLKSADIMRILASSNRFDIPEPYDPRNANGYFDPVGGMRRAIDAGGVESIENPGFQISPDDYVEVYDVTGIKRYSGPASFLQSIPKALYVVKTPYGIKKTILPISL